MSITSGIVNQMESAMKGAMGDLFSPQTVDLFGGPTVSVRLHIGMRRAASPSLTGGADTENQFATIDSDDWDNQAGRIPQKGDVIHWVGRRYAVESSQTLAPDGENVLFYKCRVNG